LASAWAAKKSEFSSSLKRARRLMVAEERYSRSTQQPSIPYFLWATRVGEGADRVCGHSEHARMKRIARDDGNIFSTCATSMSGEKRAKATRNQ
jgi:hypothetical protein